MAETSDIKKGTVLRYQGDIYLVTDFQFNKPGKGMAFTKTKLKSLTTGKTIENNFRSDEKIEIVAVSKINMQYLYHSGERYSFMNQDNYETVEVDSEVVGDRARFLKEGLKVIMTEHAGRILAMELPKKISYTVVEAPPAVKGDTASGNVTKEIVLDNGLKIQAPIFIKEGEAVFVNTESGDYAGRVTEA